MTPIPTRRLRLVGLPLSLTALAFSFPALTGGFGPLALAAWAPVFLWLDGARTMSAAALGAVFGLAEAAVLYWWLGSYHPAALVLALAVTGFWRALSFAGTARLLSVRNPLAILILPLLWAGVDAARGAGFLAFPYGTLPYALYRWDAALTLASAGGVALTGLAAWSANTLLFSALRGGQTPGMRLPKAAVWVLALAAVLGMGQAPSSDCVTASDGSAPPEAGRFRVALVQPNLEEKQQGPEDYARAIRVLIDASARAMASSPDLIVWHETAVIPPIEWHLRRRVNRELTDALTELEDFLSASPVPVLLGNGWADPEDPQRRTGGNAALLYEGGAVSGRYLKMMLVPFSEYFPAADALPGIARWLEDSFGYLWTPGTERVALSAGAASVAAPICFEDSFGPHLAGFPDTDFMVVLTDDSWARSAAMQVQHVSMSAFRAAETGSVVLRAANTGCTAAVSPRGRVEASLPPFMPGVLFADVVLGSGTDTLYERGGLWFGTVAGVLGALAGFLALLWPWFEAKRRQRPGGPVPSPGFRIDKPGGV
ncbi:MAG: apolipoprotein N-acyltransferase [Spirochaetales bacterium]|nr:apolipoprotein N-acyltransferase [Spirochaetales bacterium]